MSGYSDLHDNPALGGGTTIPQVPHYKAEHRLNRHNGEQLTVEQISEAVGRVVIDVETRGGTEQIPVNVQHPAEAIHEQAA